MNLISRIFSRTPSIEDLRNSLKAIDLNQRKKRRDLAILDERKQEKTTRAIEAKKAGRQELVRDIFREMSQLEIETGYANTDLRRLSLEKSALSSFLRKMELLEKNKDRKGLKDLLTRIQKSCIQKAIDAAEVDDDSFNNMLEELLEEEAGGGVGRRRDADDADFGEFEKTIGEMATSGSTDQVEASAGQSRQSRLMTMGAASAALRAQAQAMHADAAALMSNPHTAAAGAALEAQATAMDAQADALEAAEKEEESRKAAEEARRTAEEARKREEEKP